MIQKLIDAHELEREMYRKCIDTDEEIEKDWINHFTVINNGNAMSTETRGEIMPDSMPTVDAVEVVRCKDCIHYWKNKPSDDIPVCLASPKDDAFCSEGERREDA